MGPMVCLFLPSPGQCLYPRWLPRKSREPSLPRRPLRLKNRHRPFVTIHRYRLTALDAPGAIASAQYRWYSILPCDDGTVGRDTADVGYQTGGVRKELRPGRCPWYRGEGYNRLPL
jgi:hypothetical protein